MPSTSKVKVPVNRVELWGEWARSREHVKRERPESTTFPPSCVSRSTVRYEAIGRCRCIPHGSPWSPWCAPIWDLCCMRATRVPQR